MGQTGDYRGEYPEDNHPPRPDTARERRTEGSQPDHVDDNVRNAAMHEGIADEREKRGRVRKAACQRETRWNEREVQHERIVLLLADEIILIDIDRNGQANQR